MDINKAKEQIQNEAFEALKKNNFKGFVHIPTGVGKGKLLMDVLNFIKPDSGIYLVDSELNRDFTFKNDLKKWGYEKYIPTLEYYCYQSAHKLKGEHYNLALCDEADFSLSKEYSKFYKNNTFDYLVLCSGSLEESKKQLLKKLGIPIVYSLSIEEAEDRGAINSTKHYFVNYKLNSEENKKYLAYNDQFVTLLNKEKLNPFQLNMLKIKRKQFLSKLDSSYKVANALLKDIKNSDFTAKTIIFTGLSEQADKFKYSYHSKNEKNENLEKLHKGEIDHLAVVEKITRGQNIDGINNIIHESPSSSLTKLQQKTGRGRRLHKDDHLHCYYLIPYYKTRKGETKPTIVQSWVTNNSQDLNIKKVINYKFKSNDSDK